MFGDVCVWLQSRSLENAFYLVMSLLEWVWAFILGGLDCQCVASDCSCDTDNPTNSWSEGWRLWGSKIAVVGWPTAVSIALPNDPHHSFPWPTLSAKRRLSKWRNQLPILHICEGSINLRSQLFYVLFQLNFRDAIVFFYFFLESYFSQSLDPFATSCACESQTYNRATPNYTEILQNHTPLTTNSDRVIDVRRLPSHSIPHQVCHNWMMTLNSTIDDDRALSQDL